VFRTLKTESEHSHPSERRKMHGRPLDHMGVSIQPLEESNHPADAPLGGFKQVFGTLFSSGAPT